MMEPAGRVYAVGARSGNDPNPAEDHRTAGFMIAAIFWAGFQGIAVGLSPWLRPTWVSAFFGGSIAGYINYDLTHYAIHHSPLRSACLKRVRAHHLSHHHKDTTRKFGFTSLLWDRRFRTL
jgi:sterol desaturase/sphingolipid hydroxylase (fatty acid hydroxylase superfamily)